MRPSRQAVDRIEFIAGLAVLLAALRVVTRLRRRNGAGRTHLPDGAAVTAESEREPTSNRKVAAAARVTRRPIAHRCMQARQSSSVALTVTVVMRRSSFRKAARETVQPMSVRLEHAHVLSRFPERWPTSANPERTYTLLNRESPEFVRFVNPSDYRVAREACGACHLDIVEASVRSMHSTGVMLWGGAAYNNGILPYKHYILGESYDRNGVGTTLYGPKIPEESKAAADAAGVLPQLVSACPRGRRSSPATSFAYSRRGGRNIGNLFPETGLPDSLGQLQRIEEPGRPDFRQSNRGPGTGARIAVPVINITKTRLNDPFTWFLGTNDQPGDYRSSGCASCHVVYANDRDPRHSASYAHTDTTDDRSVSIQRSVTLNPGHPLEHSFTRAIPTSQCMVCHMHQPNMFMNSFLGYTMWDYESDAPSMWPEKQQYPSDARMHEVLERNPEAAAVRGKWADVEFSRSRCGSESAVEGHAVRRLSRSRMELPCGVQTRSQRQSARCDRWSRARHRPQEISEGGSPVFGARRRRHAVRRLPLRSGQSRQRSHLWRSRAGRRSELRRLPRHHQGVSQSVHVRDLPRSAADST